MKFLYYYNPKFTKILISILFIYLYILPLQVLGKEHIDAAISYSNIGRIYFDLGKYKQALEY